MNPLSFASPPYADRAAAGQRLIEPLAQYRGQSNAIVLALPRGGVPVAWAVADALGLPLDLILVRKLGVPSHPEVAMGAIASGAIQIRNDDALRAHHVDQAAFDAVLQRERQELARREALYRGSRPPVDLKQQVVLLVDDGLATGASMMAAVRAVRLQNPLAIVVAVPVAPVETAEALRSEVDEFVCPLMPEWMRSVGDWYEDFSQTPDETVVALLDRAWSRPRS
ncbi:phosphoribosyltransferase [Pseudomonas sp. Z1-12]|uniref:phosphoribosyltransferase n=1 Tax=Pseudomonas sp. Z1-12 TaxID=2817408 RepID=UPI003DAA28E4